MKGTKVIKKSDVSRWLEDVIKTRKIIAPCGSGDVMLGEIDKIEKINLDYVKDHIGAKRFFFPPCEKMFSFSLENGIKCTVDLPDEKRVIFGLRSCDVCGINYLENFFRSYNFPDIYFLKRRENTVLVNISCERTDETCHCVCANTGPYLTDGFDIQMTDIGEKYLVEIGSTRGEEFISSFASYFENATDIDTKEAQTRMENVKYTNRFADKTSFLAKAMKRITLGNIDEKVWEKMADGCLSCGGCIYVCPTCSCFTVLDKMVKPGEGARERFWDACVFSGYTREASGHNPRERHADRRKRWVFHKLNGWTYTKSNEKPGCVCCGRCISVCLGINNSMSKAVEMIRGEI